ncbi:oligosaccharide flippase family protein [Sphingopyxis sp. LC81]|uniref:oligosaccharide flippase family protein n=1 Tax=Sphingopyxis sp. LC81 TaxID=1502850 RepID=UPI0009DD2AEB|nr:oligosaccharide flippase family protein [Sphingopyxis sp. LC81]
MIYRNIIANYAGRTWLMASIYIFVPIYISILGAESYALIAFYTILLTFASLADVGLSSTFSRQAASEKDRDALFDTFSTMEIILLCTTISISILIIIFAPMIADRWLNQIDVIDTSTVETCLRLMAATIIPQIMMTFYSAGLIGLQKQISSNVAQSIYILIRSAFIIPVLMIHRDPVVFFVWQLGVTIAFSIIFRILLFRTIERPIFSLGRYKFSSMRPVLAFAGSMILISLISTINTQIDKLVVSGLFSVSDFGFYAAASTLAQLPVALTMPIAIAFYPRLTELLARHELLPARELYAYFSGLTAMTVSLLAGGLFMLSPEILTIWMHGQSLPPGLPTVVSLLALGSLFYGLQIVPYYLSLARGEARIILVLAIVAMLLTAPLSYISVVRFGMVGAPLPWILLNLINFIAIGFVVNRRAWSTRRMQWVIQCISLPTALGLATVFAGQWLAGLLTVNPYITVALTGVVCLIVMGVFVRAILPALAGRGLASSPSLP